jgi:type VI secretion system secreted protein VgrG
VGKDLTLSVGGDHREEVQNKRMMVVGKELSITCGDSSITIDEHGKITVIGKDITVKCDGPVKVDGQKIDVKAQSSVNVQTSGDVKVKGGRVTMN